MKPERNCTNCRNYRQAESETNEAADFGECRLLPPLLVVVNDEPLTMYPQVDDSCDCGQHEAAQ
jgi:hypothetical protein